MTKGGGNDAVQDTQAHDRAWQYGGDVCKAGYLFRGGQADRSRIHGVDRDAGIKNASWRRKAKI